VHSHRCRAPAFGLPAYGVRSPVLGFVLALALSCPVVAQDSDILVQPYEWEGGGQRYTLVAVPEPYFEGREPAMQQVLRSVRKDLVALVEKPDLEPSQLAEGFGQMGRYYHAYQLYGPAAACYINAETLAPGVFRWPYLLGYAYYQASHPDDAAAAYQRALKVEPANPAAQLRLATVYMDLNELELAEPLLEKPLQEEGLRETAAYLKGEAALARRDYESAVRYLKQVLAEGPQASKARYPLAMAYRGLGDLDSARRELKLLGEGEPKTVDPLVDDLDELLRGARTHYFSAIEAARDGDYDKAVYGFREALAQDPDNVNARVSLARALYLSGDREGAREQLAEALRRQPDHPLGNFLMGVLLDELNKPDAAFHHYQATLAADPEYAGAHFYLATALVRRGDYAQAAEHYAKAWQLEPKLSSARMLEAVALLQAGAPHKTVRDRLEQAVALYPDEAMIIVPLARLLATSPDDQVRNGARALALAKPLFEASPLLENAETLAMAYAAVGRYEDAVALQKSAISATAAAGQLFQLPRLEEALALYKAGKSPPTSAAIDVSMLRPPPTITEASFREYPTLYAY
jgi:tetratricopeptide (TPR) repeat protein